MAFSTPLTFWDFYLLLIIDPLWRPKMEFSFKGFILIVLLAIAFIAMLALSPIDSSVEREADWEAQQEYPWD